jgi:hypothetical protein
MAAQDADIDKVLADIEAGEKKVEDANNAFDEFINTMEL